MTTRARVTLSLEAVRSFCTAKQLSMGAFKERLVDMGIPRVALDQWLYKDQEPPIVLVMALLEVWPKEDPFNLLEVHDARRSE